MQKFIRWLAVFWSTQFGMLLALFAIPYQQWVVVQMVLNLLMILFLMAFLSDSDGTFYQFLKMYQYDRKAMHAFFRQELKRISHERRDE